ncbi:RNA polymerase sigma factor [Paludisphaera rhizosphaerae]|uniref:RNA polymerase sigma factor n=1 Tax=Paludisphaera rhizosphaerae TaxID=2711216 RepID=UPI001F0D4C3B|nr:RNA polymerase sigma factor [Paludisphaera rhizosphaerae]
MAYMQVVPNSIAFQATFLVLLKKARRLWVRDSLGPWLHQVAMRTALCARANAARRRKLAQAVADRADAAAGEDRRIGFELEAVLHAEIDRLPERYRAPIVLCDLEGLTCEEAAHRLGRPVGTVKSWRSRGRDRLRSRLLKRGFAPAAFPLLAINGETARAAMALARSLPAEWTSGKVSASVQGLVQGALKSMLVLKLNAAVAPALLLTFVTTGLAAWGFDREAGPKRDENRNQPAAVTPTSAPVPIAPHAVAGEGRPAVEWPLTLREALRIGLESSDRIDSVAVEGSETIVRPRRVGNPLVFKAESEVHVRSIETQYWHLLASRRAAEGWERASELGRELKNREVARVAAGEKDLEGLEQTIRVLDRARTEADGAQRDAKAAEQTLRSLLKTSETDDRRIVPTTPPRTEERKLDWEVALRDMGRNHAGILRAEAVVRGPEARRQVVHEATHALSRIWLELDANYKQLQTASKRREAASAAAQARRAAYEQGQVAGAAYGEAIIQAAEAAALEMQYLATFNTAIANLEEAKGTLLAYQGVRIVDAKPDASQGVPSVASANPHTPEAGPNPPTEIRPSVHPDGRVEPVAIAPELLRGATYSFNVSFGAGPNPYEIRGSFTVTPPAAGR